jgi:hypothetical protein
MKLLLVLLLVLLSYCTASQTKRPWRGFYSCERGSYMSSIGPAPLMNLRLQIATGFLGHDSVLTVRDAGTRKVRIYRLRYLEQQSGPDGIVLLLFDSRELTQKRDVQVALTYKNDTLRVVSFRNEAEMIHLHIYYRPVYKG